MKIEINLTLPCPLCSKMLSATYEPDDGKEVPLIADVRGCCHAQAFMDEMDGKPHLGGRFWTMKEAVSFWEALHHEARMYQLDEWAERLEQSARWRKEP